MWGSNNFLQPYPMTGFPFTAICSPNRECQSWRVVNCEELSEAELYEFAFFAATIPLRGATGAPLRPVVFPLLS